MKSATSSNDLLAKYWRVDDISKAPQRSNSATCTIFDFLTVFLHMRVAYTWQRDLRCAKSVFGLELAQASCSQFIDDLFDALGWKEQVQVGGGCGIVAFLNVQ